MTYYCVHEYDLQYGWQVVSESSNIDDFIGLDKEMFKLILAEDNEDFHVEEGNRMWTIDKEGN